MRRLLIAPLIFVLASCGYDSLYQAEDACFNWTVEGGSYKVRLRRSIEPFDFFTITKEIRRCSHEYETKQFLGFEIQEVKNRIL